MTDDDDAVAIYRAIQGQARSEQTKTGKPVDTSKLFTRHLLESFLDRLARSEHADDFVLKGGVLLAAYGVRRPTKDLDAEAIGADVSVGHLRQVVSDVVAVEASDGIEFDLDTLTIREIRDDAEYPGLRLRMKARLATWNGVTAWDVSTGDPIVPAPHRVRLPRIHGEDIVVLGYRPETTIAEKGVTILERGITSTRWRDYVDIVQLFGCFGIDDQQLVEAARAVAAYRQVELDAVAPLLAGYGALAQPKWAAWRRKERLEEMCAERLDDQVAQVAALLDPVFSIGRV